jgi:hypothetical protein
MGRCRRARRSASRRERARSPCAETAPRPPRGPAAWQSPTRLTRPPIRAPRGSYQYRSPTCPRWRTSNRQRDVATLPASSVSTGFWAFAIVGDHGTLAREGRVDESWNPSRPPIIAQSHGAADRGARHWATPPSVELAVELKLFLDALEVPEGEIGLRFLYSSHDGNGPERGRVISGGAGSAGARGFRAWQPRKGAFQRPQSSSASVP